ncbi:MAG TPA: MFS transporter [Candidatus Pacearchaeota archaeon]|nr:MFS transporter [Candidatus Pacearchaeota archaeon]
MHAHHLFHFFKNRELNELYVSISIRAFAFSLIGIFVPIYLYQRGYSFTSIFIFFGLFSLTHALFSMPVAKIVSRFGVKHSMLISIPFLIIFLLLLYSLEDFGWPLPLLSVFVGIGTSLFWISYHVDFAKFSDRKNRGKQIGLSKIAMSIFSVLGPIVGAVILTFEGFKILFIITSVLLVGSVVPLFLSREIHEPASFSLKGFFKGQKIKDVLSYLGHGIENKLGLVVWPLFIFIFILDEKYISLGLVSSLALSVALISTFIVGKFSDISRKVMLKIGSVFNALVWVAKSFIVTPLQLFVAEAFYGASQTTMHIPFDAINYDKAKKKAIIKTILEREMYHQIGAALLFLVLIFLTDSLIQIFRFGGSISSLLRFFF